MRHIDACDPDRERECEECGTSAISGAHLINEDDIPPAIGPSALRGKIASFGPFRLHVTERQLESDGNSLKIGSRALDILTMLLEHAPDVVSKRDLMRRVWGKLVVDEVSLRFHIAALRKRLGDGQFSVRYITNIPGRGYCFAGAVSWTEAQAPPRKASTTVSQLPREPLLVVGRDTAVRELIALLKKKTLCIHRRGRWNRQNYDRLDNGAQNVCRI